MNKRHALTHMNNRAPQRRKLWEYAALGVVGAALGWALMTRLQGKADKSPDK
jgi:uncharacterized membrane protein YfcA